ncbi:MAG: hypothetical protein M1840_008512 [Geoglossum simile]|nr:MAG: hypothetical protein M1840_008512 [Geoglossum simile]
MDNIIHNNSETRHEDASHHENSNDSNANAIPEEMVIENHHIMDEDNLSENENHLVEGESNPAGDEGGLVGDEDNATEDGDNLAGDKDSLIEDEDNLTGDENNLADDDSDPDEDENNPDEDNPDEDNPDEDNPDEDNPDEGNPAEDNPAENGDNPVEENEILSNLLKQLEAISKYDDPATQSVRDIIVNMSRESRQLKRIVKELEKPPRKRAGARAKGKGRNGGGKGRNIGGKERNSSGKKTTNISDEIVDIKQALKTKWRRRENDDLQEIAKIAEEERLDNEKRIVIPKIGRQSKYVETLQLLASQLISKRVNNRQSTVLVGAEDADNFLEIAQSISSPNSVRQLAEQIKLLLTDGREFSGPMPAGELQVKCYDEAGDLNHLGKIVRYGLDATRMETDDSTRRIRYRFACVKIAKHYEKEQKIKREMRKAGLCEEGESGKGSATEVKRDIIEMVGCKASCLDRWIRLGKTLTPFVNEFGPGVLGLIPKEMSDYRLLSLPIASVEHIVVAINRLHPNMRDLSELVKKHLWQNLMQWSRPKAATLQLMLSEAKELNLQIPLKRVVNSLEVHTTADSGSTEYREGRFGRILGLDDSEEDNGTGSSAVVGGNIRGRVRGNAAKGARGRVGKPTRGDGPTRGGRGTKRPRKANGGSPTKRLKVVDRRGSSST